MSKKAGLIFSPFFINMDTNSLLILGSNSAIPSCERFTSAQFLNINGKGILIDCGEGAQIRMQTYGIKPNSVDYIFISHLHGDHFFGLAGLISTMNMQNRKQPLRIFCPDKLKEIINIQMEVSLTEFQFECIYTVVTPTDSKLILKEKNFEVYSIPLNHRIDTTGFLFKSTMRNHPFEYAYISDTLYKPDIIPLIKNVNLLYHEATFLDELKQQANDKFHSTAKEAAIIAKTAEVNKLIIGHFSKRYADPTPLIDEAKSIFINTVAAEDGMNIQL